MPIGLLEITIGALVFGAWKKSEKKGILTPEREKVYLAALADLHDPVELRKLADVFEKNGLGVEATMLRRRADLRGQTAEQKQARREAYDKGMASSDVVAVERLADAFESITATGAAMALRKHAADVRYAGKTAPNSDAVLQEIGHPGDSEPIEANGTSVAAKADEDPKVVNGSATEPPAHRPRRALRTASSAE